MFLEASNSWNDTYIYIYIGHDEVGIPNCSIHPQLPTKLRIGSVEIFKVSPIHNYLGEDLSMSHVYRAESHTICNLTYNIAGRHSSTHIPLGC